MGKVNLNKQETWRLAIAIDANEIDVKDIITRIIIYTIYKYESPMTIVQIVDSIDKEVATFDYKEIEDTIIYNDRYFAKICIGEDVYYDITGEARVIFENKNKNVFEESVRSFKEQNNIDASVDYIKDIILNYLYSCIAEDCTLIVKDLKTNKIDESIRDEIDKEKDLINKYICWSKNNKEDVLIKMALSLIDFCYLSANANDNVVRELIGNKNFYLDANVIFRLMGLNNQERKNSIERFIEKCKVYDIKLYITNHTDKEMRETLKYYSSVISNNYVNYKGNGEINRFFGIEDNSLYSLFIDNKKNKGIYDNHKFYSDLIDLYEKTTEQFEKTTLCKDLLKIDKDLRESYKSIHTNIWDISIDADLFNILSIKNSRNSDKNKTLNYFITEDKKLLNWANENISSFEPLATFPSQWFTLFLKLGKRNISVEEKTAFYNFLVIDSSFKMTDVEKGDIKKHIASEVNKSVDNGFIQDRIYKKLQCEDIKKLKDSAFVHRLIHETTEEYINEQKTKEYSNGRYDMINELINEKIKYKEQMKKNLVDLRKKIPIESSELRKRNIVIIVVFAVISIIIFLVLCLMTNIASSSISSILTLIANIVILNFFPVNIEQCSGIIENKLKNSNDYIKIEKEISLTESEIQEMENKRDSDLMA